ncbi:hypothetical protein DMUE_0199 [Dictyocoela muelleri]|nr:hypothetical protein DMUE_0199 [Dictyocoela muelleri]
MLEEYDYELKHISGENNNEADILSRSFHIKSEFLNRYQKILARTNALINKLNNIKDKEKTNSPTEDITEKLRELHSLLIHLGRNKMLNTIKDYVKIKNLKKIITNICKNCTKYQEEKSYTKTNVLTRFVAEPLIDLKQ